MKTACAALLLTACFTSEPTTPDKLDVVSRRVIDMSREMVTRADARWPKNRGEVNCAYHQSMAMEVFTEAEKVLYLLTFWRDTTGVLETQWASDFAKVMADVQREKSWAWNLYETCQKKPSFGAHQTPRLLGSSDPPKK